MSTDASFIDTVLERLGPLDVSARAMFGEYGLYVDGKNFALVCDNTLFIKVTDAGRGLAGRIATASPYPGAKPALRISSAKLRDRDWLVNLVRATSADLAPPKVKKRAP